MWASRSSLVMGCAGSKVVRSVVPRSPQRSLTGGLEVQRIVAAILDGEHVKEILTEKGFLRRSPEREEPWKWFTLAVPGWRCTRKAYTAA